MNEPTHAVATLAGPAAIAAARFMRDTAKAKSLRATSKAEGAAISARVARSNADYTAGRAIECALDATAAREEWAEAEAAHVALRDAQEPPPPGATAYTGSSGHRGTA